MDVNDVGTHLNEYVRSSADSENLNTDEMMSSLSDDDDDAATWPGFYDVPKHEAELYYAGVGSKGRGPKLIYRTSEDTFEKPSGPEYTKRLMRIVAVPDSFDFGSNVTWDTIRDRVRIFDLHDFHLTCFS